MIHTIPREIIYMEPCLGCKEVYLPEDVDFFCDNCIEHVMSVEETGGSE